MSTRILDLLLLLNSESSSNSAPPSLPADPSLSNPTFALQGTTYSNDLAADGYSWANASPILIDKYDNIISADQRQNGGDKKHNLIFSNDGGSIWEDNTGLHTPESFLERVTLAYDSTNDLLWGISHAGSEGAIVRRYTFNRDVDNTILSIDRQTDVSVALDSNLSKYVHPLLLHVHDAAFGPFGALVACWGCVDGSGKTEVRAVMIDLQSDVSRANTASNWVHIAGASVSTLSNSPNTASYTALYASAVAVQDSAYPSLGIKSSGTHAKDIYLCYHDGDKLNDGSMGLWRWRRFGWSSGSSNWSGSGTSAATITAMRRAGSDTGYELKRELGTSVHSDATNDRMIFGFPNWKSNTDGDTWSFMLINSDDTLGSLADAYSAGGAHSLYPTGDTCYDSISDRIVVAYLKSGTEHLGIRIYDGVSAAQDEIDAFSDAIVDIPLLYPRFDGKVLVLFRDSDSSPYKGWFGRLDWN